MRKIKSIILVKIFLFVTLIIQAQEISVTIKVVTQKKEAVAFASITVSSRTDSTQIITKVADSSGIASFNLQRNGQYIVYISSINYQPLEKRITISGNQSSFIFTPEPAGKTLGEVVITSQKPLMRQEDDKLIVDPANLADASTSGYEVIEKTPGLFVDQDGNVYISSMSPAAIQINGRDMKMSAADVATMLKNLPPNSILRIEIIKTPSAKYDASSGGGIVNVVLKKGVKIGMTGSINSGIQQGVYGNQFIGFNLTNNSGNKTSYLNFNYGRRNSYEKIITNRIFNPDSVLSQESFTKYPGSTIYTAFGITWELGKKWGLTYDGSLNYNNFDNPSQNDNSIEKISTSQIISNSINAVNNDGYNLSLGSGFETKYKIDSLGSEWTNDFFFTRTSNQSDQNFSANYYSPFVSFFAGDGTVDNKRNHFTGRSDLLLKMKNRFTFETGIQSTIHAVKNVTNYFREVNGVRTKDISRTNTFDYNQNINSLYLQGAKTLGKDFIAKFGTRIENTNINGQQTIPGDTSFSIQRTDLFPYIYLSKKLMKIAGYDLRAYLVYRRTTNRPNYEQLNPFSRYVDEFLTETGNPGLRPQFNNNYEANISVDERPIFAVGINDTKDIFTNVVYQSDTSQTQAIRTYDNLGKNKEFYFRGLGALPPGGRYFLVAGAQYNHNFYQGLYENKPLSFKRGTWTFFTYQTFKLDKKSVITLNGFWRLKGQQQFYELSPFGSLSTSINRRFFKEKLVVTISLNDMFYTNKNNFTLNQGSVSASGLRRADTRRFGINLRYNFGIRKKEDNNNMFNVEQPATN